MHTQATLDYEFSIVTQDPLSECRLVAKWAPTARAGSPAAAAAAAADPLVRVGAEWKLPSVRLALHTAANQATDMSRLGTLADLQKRLSVSEACMCVCVSVCVMVPVPGACHAWKAHCMLELS